MLPMGAISAYRKRVTRLAHENAVRHGTSD